MENAIIFEAFFLFVEIYKCHYNDWFISVMLYNKDTERERKTPQEKT